MKLLALALPTPTPSALFLCASVYTDYTQGIGILVSNAIEVNVWKMWK